MEIQSYDKLGWYKALEKRGRNDIIFKKNRELLRLFFYPGCLIYLILYYVPFIKFLLKFILFLLFLIDKKQWIIVIVASITFINLTIITLGTNQFEIIYEFEYINVALPILSYVIAFLR